MSEYKFEGKWQIAGDSNWYDGKIEINTDDGVILLLLFVKGGKVPGLATPDLFTDNRTLDIINGSLVGMGIISLVNCVIHHRHGYYGSHSQITLLAEKAYWGEHFNAIEDSYYKHYSLKINNTLNWCNLCHFEVDETGKYEWIKRDRLEFKLSDNLSVALYPVLKDPGFSRDIKEDFILKQYIEFSFEYNTTVSLDDFLRDYHYFELLITMGAGTQPSISKIEFYNPKNTLFPAHPSDIVRPSRVFVNRKKIAAEQMLSYKMLFTLDDLVDNNCNIFDNWNQKRILLEPIMNLYFSLICYSDMSLEMQFLNIVQALETYHSRFLYKDKLKKYKEHLTELFKCDTDQIPAPHKDAYFCETQADENLNYIILKSRLVDLFNDDFHCPLFVRLFKDDYSLMYQYIDTIVDTRHYYTHYGKSKEKKALRSTKLICAIDILSILLEYHFLKELEFDISYRMEKISTRCNNLRNWYKSDLGLVTQEPSQS
ncbi:MAG: hypothetical protein EOM00_03225 [Clostridia bacterium]|nr:hypothetical protein [Clostridia bacterium]